ncbi:MAG: T9SS type A sorting domain-containing protein [candidate division Zixibacteria bacterium]|nr:T9SS type A sorting domain-containing protein [candidate division Zixibacteria bacterium]
MLKIKKVFVMVLAASLVFGASASFAADNLNIGEENPIVLVPCDHNLSIADSVPSFAGQDSINVPIIFQASNSAVSITRIEFSISMPDGVDFNSFTLNSWEGDYNIYQSGNNFEVQCWNYTLVLAPNEIVQLVDFYFDVHLSVGPDSVLPFGFVDDVYFYESGDPLAYDPLTYDGSIRTYSDSCWVDVADNITGFSNQAMDENKDIYVEVPVNLYTKFPCTFYRILLSYRPNGLEEPNPPIEEWPLQYVGYDTANVKYGTYVDHPYAPGYGDILVIAKTIIPYDTIYADMQIDSLVTLYFKVNDFHNEFNADANFDTLLDVIQAVSSISNEYSFLGTTPGNYVYLYENENFHGGSVYIPGYSTELQIGFVDVFDTTTVVSVPVYVKPTTSFYIQHYETKLEYEPALLTLQSITVGDAPVPQNIQFTDLGTYDDWNTIEVMTYDLQDDQYIEPDIYDWTTIYTLNFAPTDSFLSLSYGNAYIMPAEGWGCYGLVLDYFSVPGFNSIVRDNYDANFSFQLGRVHRVGGGRSLTEPIESVDALAGTAGTLSGDDLIPHIYCLHQNYPNPFNATTNIEFSIAEPGYVILDIYNMLGKKVRSLVSADMSAGAHQVIWDGTNNQGTVVSSGFYFYSLTSEKFQQTKKMLLLK